MIDNEAARLLRDIREEVIGLLFNRYVFRTHQEIVRQNPSLQGRPRIIFAQWGWTVYAVANSIGVRRLAGESFKDGEVNLVRLLDLLIRNPANLWPRFEECYPDEAVSARTAIPAKSRNLESGWEVGACKRLLCEDRTRLINAAKKASRFANKRAAHSVPGAEVSTSFSDLDQAIDTLVQLTEKYTRLTENDIELLQEMKSRKLPEGWDSIFLEAWATPEVLALNLGETRPPDKKRRPR